MRASNICILDILIDREYGHEITEPYVKFHRLGTEYTQQSARTTTTSVPSKWVWGNGEEGMREYGNRWELDCMVLQPETENNSLISNERYEWSLYQPTWKGIQFPRNGFTSRESEHSLCNGQAKALQNAKDQLKNDKNIWSFLMTSFY